MSEPEPRQELEPLITHSATVLFGRDAELQAVLTSSAPVLLIIGDSGIGKSELLRAAQEATHRSVAPPPITLAQPRGSLQRALLQGLADATGELTREQGRAREVVQRVAAAAKKLTEDNGIDFAKAVARALLLKVKETVGADAVDVVAEYVRDLRDVGQDALLERIWAAASPSITDVLVGLATEVVDLAGERAPVVIALDAAEFLHEDDRALLADVAGRLPSGLKLRVGFGTWSEKHRAQAEDLCTATSQSRRWSFRASRPTGFAPGWSRRASTPRELGRSSP